MPELLKIKPVGPILGKSTGTMEKPDWCGNNCPRAYYGSGFVADWVPENPRLAVLFDAPHKDDVVNRMPADSGYGRFFWAAIAKEVGFTKDQVILSHVLRCFEREYPIGEERKKIETACRHWDITHNVGGLPKEGRSLAQWNPNIFVYTFDVGKMIEIPAYYALALSDFRKALRFADSGYRPLVVMGTEVFHFAAPWLDGTGGIKAWRGSWHEGDWKWMNKTILEHSGDHPTTEETGPLGFREAAPWKRPRKSGRVKKTKEPKQLLLPLTPLILKT